MENERPIDVKNQADAKKKMSDAVVIGNNDNWQLITKFASKSIDIMHSTKGWEIPGKGVLVQCSSEVKGQLGMALEFIPNVSLIDDVNGGKTLI